MSNRYIFLFYSLLLITGLHIYEANAQSNPPFGDIHVHSSIKPFNSRHIEKTSHWELIEHNCEEDISDFFIKNTEQLPRRSQSNFEALVKGNVGFICLSLTPLERQMLHPRLLNIKQKGVHTFACLSGVQTSYEFIIKEEMNYYADLAANLQFVIQGENKPYYINNVPHFFEIIKTKQQFEAVNNDPHRLAVILSIEGAHALGNSVSIDKDITESPNYHQFVLNNVDRLKGTRPLIEGFSDTLKYPVLFLGLDHFFWNGICGHARTFTGTQELVFGVQKKSDGGFTPLGRKVLHKMLDKEQGKRILVDVKHMSLQSRQEYYTYLDSLAAQGDTIPIISSHSTVTNLSWTDKEYQKNDNISKNKKSYLNNWTISLAKEDVQRIHQSNGMIGIMLDKYRLMGGRAKDAHKKVVPGSVQRRKFLVKVIMANIFAAIEAIDDPSAWNTICIGSDYDGMVIPPDTYPTHQEFNSLANDLKNFLEYPSDIFDLWTAAEIEDMKYGLSSNEIVNKIMSQNLQRFLMENLPDEQLPVISEGK